MDYWNSTEILNDVYHCSEKHYREAANTFVVIQDGHALLIDAGTGCAPLHELSRALGVTFDACFLTHAHFDHAFGITELSCPVYASGACRERLLQGNDFGLEYFSIADVSGDKTMQLKYKNFSARVAELARKASSIAAIEKSFQWRGYAVAPVPLAGHTDDSTGFLLEPLHVLFSGDALYDGEPYFACASSSVAEGLQSLRRIEGIAPTSILPGHNSVLSRAESARVLEQWRVQLRA